MVSPWPFGAQPGGPRLFDSELQLPPPRLEDELVRLVEACVASLATAR